MMTNEQIERARQWIEALRYLSSDAEAAGELPPPETLTMIAANFARTRDEAIDFLKMCVGTAISGGGYSRHARTVVEAYCGAVAAWPTEIQVIGQWMDAPRARTDMAGVDRVPAWTDLLRWADSIKPNGKTATEVSRLFL
jgi:hypothetical protein